MSVAYLFVTQNCIKFSEVHMSLSEHLEGKRRVWRGYIYNASLRELC
jgi:hypothetical protein